MIAKVGLDQGKGFLKMSLSVYDPENLLDNSRYKNSGPFKTMLIAVANCQENYTNCKKFFDETSCHEILHHFACDLKISNICTGLTPHSASFCCPYCEGNKGEWSRSSRLRNFSSILRHFEGFIENGGIRSKAKFHYGAINRPLFQGNWEGEDLVLIVLPPPLLHLRLGIVNKLMDVLYQVDDQLEPLVEKVLHVSRTDYHGNAYEGNATMKLMKNVDMLTTLIQPPKLASCFPILACLQEFQNVYEACFLEDPHPNYWSVIAKFENCYLDFCKIFCGGRHWSTKAHIVISHIGQYIDRTGKTPCKFQEQVVEQTHAEFDRLWKSSYKTNEGADNYAERLLNCVQHYNSYRI